MYYKYSLVLELKKKNEKIISVSGSHVFLMFYCLYSLIKNKNKNNNNNNTFWLYLTSVRIWLRTFAAD